MINLKDPKDQTPSLIAILGIVGMVASVIGLVTYQKFDQNKLNRAKNKADFEQNKKWKEAKEELEISEVVVSRYRWAETPQNIVPAALSEVNTAVKKNGVRMVNFRPQRATESESLLQLPFSFTLDGPFPKVAATMGEFEKNGSRLALNQVQFSAMDGESDVVTASVTVVAFAEKPKANAKSTKTVGQTGSSDVKAPVETKKLAPAAPTQESKAGTKK